MTRPLDDFASATSLCAGCPKMCRHVCPVSNAGARDTVTPGNKMAVLDLVRLGHVKLDQEVGSVWHACTACGACTQFCMFGNDVATALVGARQAVVERGVSPVADRFARAMATSGNPTGENLGQLQREQVPSRPERGALVLFPGCTALRRLPEHAADALAAVERVLGGALAVCPLRDDAACCGYPLWAAGMVEPFVLNARRVAQHLAGRGVVLTADPGCAYTLTTLYRAFGVEPALKVLHVSQWLANATEMDGAVARVRTQRSLYHDPCHLGRKLGVYNEPRLVLARVEGGEPLEFVWNRERSECCGAGGLYPVVEPAASKHAALRRLKHETDEMLLTGATRLVTACPSCEVQFARAGVEAWDLCRAVLGASKPGPRS